MNNIYIIATMHFLDVNKDELHSQLSSIVELSRAESGNIRYDLHQDQLNKNSFVFYEVWEDETALNTHKTSQHFQDFFAFVNKHATDVTIKNLSLFEL